MKRIKAMLLGLCVVGLLGCPKQEIKSDVALLQATVAPPTLTAELIDDDRRHEIRLSAGVAMGVTCWDSCEGSTSLCQGFTVTSADDSIISVREAFRANGQPTYVLAASASGRTNVTVRTACGSQSYTAMAVD